MAWELLANGSLLDARHIAQYESKIQEGQRALLELDLRAPLPPGIVTELETKLRERGVKEIQVSTASPLLRISWRKGFPFLSVVLAIILGIVILAILIVGWRLFREVAGVVPAPVLTSGLILVIAIVALMAWRRYSGSKV
jgi:hypothetical protein